MFVWVVASRREFQDNLWVTIQLMFIIAHNEADWRVMCHSLASAAFSTISLCSRDAIWNNESTGFVVVYMKTLAIIGNSIRTTDVITWLTPLHCPPSMYMIGSEVCFTQNVALDLTKVHLKKNVCDSWTFMCNESNEPGHSIFCKDDTCNLVESVVSRLSYVQDKKKDSCFIWNSEGPDQSVNIQNYIRAWSVSRYIIDILKPGRVCI